MRAISAKTGCARWQLTIDDGDVQKIRMGRVLFDDFRWATILGFAGVPHSLCITVQLISEHIFMTLARSYLCLRSLSD
jgi:hypothetical protein